MLINSPFTIFRPDFNANMAYIVEILLTGRRILGKAQYLGHLFIVVSICLCFCQVVQLEK